MKSSILTGLFAMSTALATDVTAQGDIDEGQKQFRRCASCHMVGDDAVNRVGPVLTTIFGAPIAGDPNFRYSNALRDAGDAGAIWDHDALDAFLAKPRDYLPGNKMSFRGLNNPDDRANLIAYLRSFADGGATTPVDAAFVVTAEILAIEGDVEYGEYLASECKTCHLSNGGDDGIPNIVGLSTDDFATAMHAYRAKFRENPVMQIIANRLNDEEIAALAAYFRDLEN